VKLEIIAPVPGRSYIIGHTVLVEERFAKELIEYGFAKVHPTESDPGPTHKCPCEDKHDEPCANCDAEKAFEDIENLITKNTNRTVKKTTSQKK
jgi:hypothetical protein